MTRLSLLAFLFLLATGVARAQLWPPAGPAAPAVRLVDASGQAWRLDELIRDRPVLIGFFYTGCRSLCPLETARMQRVRQTLMERGAGAPPLLISISLQPWADTPARISDFAARFGIPLGLADGWLMLTGAPADLARVWRAFGQDSDPAEHGGELWVGRPDRAWRAFRPGAGIAEIAEALEAPP